jgi:hypothetical protein
VTEVTVPVYPFAHACGIRDEVAVTPVTACHREPVTRGFAGPRVRFSQGAIAATHAPVVILRRRTAAFIRKPARTFDFVR